MKRYVLALAAAAALATTSPANAGEHDHIAEAIAGNALDLAENAVAQAIFIAEHPGDFCPLLGKAGGTGGFYIITPLDPEPNSGERVNTTDAVVATAACQPGVGDVSMTVTIQAHVEGRNWGDIDSVTCDNSLAPVAPSPIPPCVYEQSTDLGDYPGPSWLGHCRRAKLTLNAPATGQPPTYTGFWGCSASVYLGPEL
jgi:hypothetical protein